jgi:polyhydroxybutyrate depolymerase
VGERFSVGGCRVWALLGAVLGACGHAAAPRTVSGVDASSSGSSAPDAADLAPPTTVTLAVTAGGLARVVVVHAPGDASGPAGRPLPLVLNLHGSGGTAAEQEVSCGMDALADAQGFIVAYPQGAIPLGAGFAWNVPGQPLLGGQAVPQGAPDDAVFVAAAVAAIGRAYPVDPRRVFATGMSGGARMASQLGCDLSMLVAAVAPVAGLRFPSPCNASRPVPVVAFHGTADTVNPYDGNGQAYWTYSVPSAEQQWAAHDGCGAAPDRSQAAPSVGLTTYSGCAGGAAVSLYTIDGAGHEWPGAPGQSTAIDASATMWAFFAAHPFP